MVREFGLLTALLLWFVEHVDLVDVISGVA